MKILAAFCMALLLGGCANAPPLPSADDLFHDDLFAPPRAVVRPDAALAISPAMRTYLGSGFQNLLHADDKRRRLVDALYHGDLRLEYDATMTRTAAEAFDAREGNCLALVLMTAAFAKEIGLKVQYQAVVGEASWDRANDLYIAIGHVNLRLDDRNDPGVASTRGSMVVDFLAPRDAETLDTRPITEDTVVAMYANNRAVESWTQGKADDAYWWTRAALQRDPGLTAAYMTLAVVYRGQRRPDLSDEVLGRVLAREPDNVDAISNRVVALRDLGRDAEAAEWGKRLEQLDPHPPFSYFKLGMAALHAGRPDAARRLFAIEIERDPNHQEFEYWLAISYFEMHDLDDAARHLQRAMEGSTTAHDHDLYAAKLARLKAMQTQSQPQPQ